MKDFLKWLGVDEKVAKIVVWIFIFMVFLIVINTALESVGLPFYKLTAENLSKIDLHVGSQMFISWVIVLLNFYASTLLVFSVKEAKNISRYALIFLILNVITNTVVGYTAAQIMIFLYLILFAYYYSEKNKKYILYMIGSVLINTVVQYICYMFKMKFINIPDAGMLNRLFMSLDYFIIMFVIILIKEIYIKNKIKKVR